MIGSGNKERKNMNFLDSYKNENEKRMSVFTQKQKRILALMCLERQFYTYRKLARGKIWARSEQYRELLDRFWTIVLSELEVDDSIWYLHEKIRSDNLCNGIAYTFELCMANIFASHIEEWLDYLIDEPVHEEAFRLLTIDFILVYLNEGVGEAFAYDKFENHALIVNEMKRQIRDEIDMQKIINFGDAKNWYNQCEGIF